MKFEIGEIVYADWLETGRLWRVIDHACTALPNPRRYYKVKTLNQPTSERTLHEANLRKVSAVDQLGSLA